MNKMHILLVTILLNYLSPIIGQNKMESLGNISMSIPYNVKNNEKAKGLEFTIRYFKNWLVSSGDRPNIPIKFETIILNTAFTCFVQILDLQTEIDKNEHKKLHQDFIDEFKNKSGISLEKIIKDIKIDGISGIKYIYGQKIKKN